MRARYLALIGAVAVLGTAGAIWLVARSEHTENKWVVAALAVTAGLAFIASGLTASWRRPDNPRASCSSRPASSGCSR